MGNRDEFEGMDIQSGGPLVGIRCKCAKGHVWDCACASIWTEMPDCPQCNIPLWGIPKPAVAFRGLFLDMLNRES